MSRAFRECGMLNRALDKYKVGDYLLLESRIDEYSSTKSAAVVTKIVKGIAHPLLNDFIVTPRIYVKLIESGQEIELARALEQNCKWSMYAHDDFSWNLVFKVYKVVSTDRMVIRKHIEQEILRRELAKENDKRYRAEGEERRRQEREQLERNNQLVTKSELDDLAKQLE